jgi:hypothetical protein
MFKPTHMTHTYEQTVTPRQDVGPRLQAVRTMLEQSVWTPRKRAALEREEKILNSALSVQATFNNEAALGRQAAFSSLEKGSEQMSEVEYASCATCKCRLTYVYDEIAGQPVCSPECYREYGHDLSDRECASGPIDQEATFSSLATFSDLATESEEATMSSQATVSSLGEVEQMFKSELATMRERARKADRLWARAQAGEDVGECMRQMTNRMTTFTRLATKLRLAGLNSEEYASLVAHMCGLASDCHMDEYVSELWGIMSATVSEYRDAEHKFNY